MAEYIPLHEDLSRDLLVSGDELLAERATYYLFMQRDPTLSERHRREVGRLVNRYMFEISMRNLDARDLSVEQPA